MVDDGARGSLSTLITGIAASPVSWILGEDLVHPCDAVAPHLFQPVERRPGGSHCDYGPLVSMTSAYPASRIER